MQNTNSLNSDGASSTIGLTSDNCHKCYSEFNPKNRSHHCRLCGNSFCHDCSSHRSLIPPSSIVLPKTGKTRNHYKNTHNRGNGHGYANEVSTSNEDLNQALPNSPYERTSPEVCGADSLLYGRGLEERYKLAREPLRVCDTCCLQLEPIQHELRASNSNAVRYNSIDPTDIKRLFNSPLAFTLGHEVRKVRQIFLYIRTAINAPSSII